jgi:hypothetical protein
MELDNLIVSKRNLNLIGNNLPSDEICKVNI